MLNRISSCVGVLGLGAAAWGVAGCARTSPPSLTIPPAIDSLARSALEPLHGQGVTILIDSAPRELPNVRVYRATRVPPFGIGQEDARPPTAAIVERDGSLMVVTRIIDLPAAWTIARPAAVIDTAQSLRSVLRLLFMTGVANRDQIVSSSAAAKLAAQASTVPQPEALDSVSAPRVLEVGGQHLLRLYLDRAPGIYEYEFSFSQQSELKIVERRLSQRWLGP